jgi:Protein of unknown function (DUF1326)
MMRFSCLTALAFVAVSLPVSAAGVSGEYVECRDCDVYTGPCFANAEMNLTGKNAVLGWKIQKGSLDGVKLDGLSVVAVVVASDTLGLKQTGPSRALLFVDEKADSEQRAALVRFARTQGGDLLKNCDVRAAGVDVGLGSCKEGGCARLDGGGAKMETRCIDMKHDKKCGNETAFYPPLVQNVKVTPAVATEVGFSGKGLNQTWREHDRRGAYVGTFEVK